MWLRIPEQSDDTAALFPERIGDQEPLSINKASPANKWSVFSRARDLLSYPHFWRGEIAGGLHSDFLRSALFYV